MKNTILLAIALLSLSGCMTTQSLSPEQKAEITDIHISNTIGESIHYQKYGVTIFQNTDRQPINNTVIPELLAFVEKELVSRGYNVVASMEDADAILEFSAYKPDIPYTNTMYGPGLFVHKSIGFNTGVQTQPNICIRLKNAETKKQIVADCIGRNGKPTGIKEAHDDWNEFPEKSRIEMIQDLANELTDLTLLALDEMGI